MVEKYEIINNEEKITGTLNSFFTNIFSNTKNTPFQDSDSVGRIHPVVGDDPITFKLNKHKNDSNAIAINFFS